MYGLTFTRRLATSHALSNSASTIRGSSWSTRDVRRVQSLASPFHEYRTVVSLANQHPLSSPGPRFDVRLWNNRRQIHATLFKAISCPPAKYIEASIAEERNTIEKWPDASVYWTEQEDSLLLQLRRDGTSYSEIQASTFPHRTVQACARRVLAIKLPRHKTKSVRWQKEEREVFHKLHAKGHSQGEIARAMGRRVMAVISLYKWLGLNPHVNRPQQSGRAPWTSADDEILRPYLHQTPDLAKMLCLLPKRNETAVSTRLTRLRRQAGLAARPCRAWNSESDEELAKLYAERLDYAEIARRLDRSPNAVKARVCELRRRNVIVRQKSSGRRREAAQSQGHSTVIS